MTPNEHRAAAEQALTDAWNTGDPHATLLRALTHAVLALTENPHPPPATAPSPHAQPDRQEGPTDGVDEA